MFDGGCNTLGENKEQRKPRERERMCCSGPQADLPKMNAKGIQAETRGIRMLGNVGWRKAGEQGLDVGPCGQD